MAIIYSYPQFAPKPEDLLIGTVTLDENATVPIYDNPTVSFTIQSLLDMIAPVTGAQNLQQVTNIGATTSNTVTFTSDIKVTGRFYDSSGSPGAAGQVLSSTLTGTSWIVNAPASVTSVGLSMPAAFSVANSPVTTAGVLTVTGAGTALQYINGLGNLVTFPTIPTQYVLPLAADGTRGGIQIGYAENAKNYPVELSNEKAFVNVPWTDTVYTLPLAADGTRGGVQIGYTENAKNYPVELSSEKMFVNVPWTDTPYVLPVATSTDLGGVKIGYTENAKNYPVELSSDQMFVNVPWTDTQNPFQTITGAGSNNTDSGVLLSNSGGTVLILGAGSVTAAQSGNTITLTGVDTDTGITGVTLAIANSTGAPLSESITNRELTLTSHKYVGGTNVGYVPEGGTNSTFLRGDGSWGAIPTGLQFKGTWDASGSGGGNPDLTTLTPADGWLYIVSVAGSAAPNGSGVAPNSWNLGDWCIYDGSAWTRVPATNAGVTSVTTTDGGFINLTPNAATTGAVTVTADLSAQDGTSDTNTKFLSKDNTWDVPSYTGAGVTTFTNTNGTFISAGTENSTATGAVTIGTIDLSATGLSGTPATAATQFLSGANTWSVPPGTYTLPLAANGTRGGVQIGYTTSATDRNYAIQLSSEKMFANVPWTDTQENTTWYIRDSADADKTIDNDKYLKFVTATGTLGTALTGTGTTGDPYVMTLTSPDTNTQNTYTAGAGLSLSSFEFSADINTTAASSGTNNLSTDSGKYYAVQLDNNSTAADRKMVVNVPWVSGGTYSWKVRDNASTPVNKTVLTDEFLQFKTATGTLATGLAGTGTTGDPYVMTLTSPNDDTLYALAGAADGSVAANYNLVLSADGTTQNTMVFKQGGNITFTRAADSLTIAAANDNDQYALAGAASATAGEYNLVLSNDGTDQDTMVFKEGSNVTFTRAADSLTIAAANDNDNTTYSIDVPSATTNINLKGANPSSNDAIALTPSTGVSIIRNSNSQLTFSQAASISVTVASSGGSNKYYLDGVLQADAILKPSFVYRFDQSDTSNGTGGGHPLRFSSDSANSSPYTTGVTAVGTPGTAGAYTQIIITQATPYLYYYCTSHSGMGGNIPLTFKSLTTTGTGAASLTNGILNVPNTTYTLPLAANGTRGGVQIGYTESGKNYPVELSSEKMFVNVPWTDEDTTYTAGTGLDLSATDVFSIDSSVVTKTGTQTLTNKTLTSPVLGGTTTTASGNLVVKPASYILEVQGDGTYSGTVGQLQLNCSNNNHGQTLAAQPHSASVTNTMLLPKGANSTLVSEVSTSTLTNKSGNISQWTNDSGYVTAASADLQSVTARGSSTSISSTFSGGLTSSGILTSSGTGADAYTYFTGNSNTGVANTPPSSTFTHGMAQAWNNSGGSREFEYWWATGSDIEGSPAVPATGYTANKNSYMSWYNRYAGASTSGTPEDTRMAKWYGRNEFELLDVSSATWGSSGTTPTFSTPYIRLPLVTGTSGQVLTRKSGSTRDTEWTTLPTGDLTAIVAGSGMTGTSLSGPIPTLNVIGSNGITANADNITMSGSYTGDLTITGDAVTDSYRFRANHSNPTTTTATLYDQANVGATISAYRFAVRSYDGTNMLASALFTNTSLTVVGDVIAFGSPSDITLKENIKPIESALDKVSKLQGVTFNWKKSDSILDIKEDIGFIAQDVQKVLPELVKENKDGILSMRHQGIAPILLEAIKELKAEIEELKSNKCNCNR